MEALQAICVIGFFLFLAFGFVPLLMRLEFGGGVQERQKRAKREQVPYQHEYEIEHAYRIGKISRDERDRYIRTIR